MRNKNLIICPFVGHLRKQQKCRHVPPPWMDVDTLEAIKEAEKGTQSFTKMPSDHYMVETKLIIGATPEDIPRSEEIRTIIKDIFDIRMSKYRAFMDTYVRGESTQIKLDNLTSFEIHSCTPVFTHALDLIGRLKEVRSEDLPILEVGGCLIADKLLFRNPTPRPTTVRRIVLGLIAEILLHRDSISRQRIRALCPVLLIISNQLGYL